jgi:hypothetical protein
MNRMILAIAFALGAGAILWIGAGFVGMDVLALLVTLVIGAVYLLGFVELLQFRRATATLTTALDNVPAPLDSLDGWLRQLHPSLQEAVRLRIEGERQALPGPVFAPYLVGLLVMLGLLGTFIGMVVTLKGAVLALEGTTELQAIRAGLTTPIKGLGLAFGTSVAGVAASAMLGFIATLSRRERLQASGQLDSTIASVLRPFSLAHNRQETFKAMQAQAHMLPELVNRLRQMGDHLLQGSQQLGATLLANQQAFQHSVHASFAELGQSVARSLQQHLADSGRLTAQTIEPLLQTSLQEMARNAQQTQQQLHAVVQQHLQGVGERFEQTREQVAAAWQQGLENVQRAQQQLLTDLNQTVSSANERLAGELRTHWQDMTAQTAVQQQRTSAALENSADRITTQLQSTSENLLQEMQSLLGATGKLIDARQVSEQHWQSDMALRTEQLVTVVRGELAALRDAEAERGDAAVARLSALEASVATHLSQLGKELEAPMARLIDTAARAPQAAADIIEQMRANMSANMEHDNALLAERTHLLNDLAALMTHLNTSANDQRRAVEELVRSASTLLNDAGAALSQQISADSDRLEAVAAQLSGSSSEVASLSEAFGFAVELFRESNEKLIDSFQRVESALEKSASRNDEQLAYYVAQAREIIDLSMMSQKEVFEELRRISQPAAVAAANVDAEAEEVC